MPDYALTQCNSNVIRNKRKLRRDELVPIPMRWNKVVSMHLAGVPTRDICEETGYSMGNIYQILKNPRVQAVRQQMLSVYQDEFEALFPKVTQNIRSQLDSKDIKTQQVAQDQWFKAEKKFSPKRNQSGVAETAEDMVAKLLNVNVQVNVAPQPGDDGG